MNPSNPTTQVTQATFLVLHLIFWSSLLLFFYTYFGYPLLLWLISLFKSKHVKKAQSVPPVTFIITAYNEEATIKSKIENTLSLDYPKDKLQIIIASDASTDATESYVLEYQDEGVELVRANRRMGKENAQKHAIDRAKGDIIIFSDVATILKPDAIRNIVSNFNDPSIGCVSSVDKFIDKEGKLSGEGAYVKYEMFLRTLESKVNTLVGLSGSFFASRSGVCKNWRVDLQSDFNTLLNSIKMGYRGISDPHSVGYYKNIYNLNKEHDRKVRTVVRGITVFMNNLTLLNPFKYGLFSWQLFSHKLMRWLVPLFMLTAIISNFLLVIHSKLYLFLFIIHIGFYIIAYTCKNSNNPLLKLPYFFVIVNKAIIYAWIQYLKGIRYHSWTPSQR